MFSYDKSSNLQVFWRQAVNQAVTAGKTPMLLAREDNGDNLLFLFDSSTFRGVRPIIVIKTLGNVSVYLADVFFRVVPYQVFEDKHRGMG